ncbi:hypothetical protein MAHJHV60_45550 [Mycobacterium avium subsp. hominissuis]
MAALGQGGYIGREDAANLTASYEFLRLLEHRRIACTSTTKSSRSQATHTIGISAAR